jgi:hypothetical protein
MRIIFSLCRYVSKFGHVPSGRDSSFTRGHDAGGIISDMNERLRAMENKRGSPSPSKTSRRPYAVPNQSEVSDRLMGKLALRLDECEKNIEKLNRLNSSERANGTTSANNNYDVKELRGDLKLLGKNTSKACRTLSAGLADVQNATLLMYKWADNVHSAFETISYKLEFPTNICPRVKVDIQQSAIKS